MADDEDSVLSQGDPPSGVKKQVPSDSDAAVQVDQPQHVPVKVTPGQLSETPSVKTTAIQADQPQHLPVQAVREVHYVFVPTVVMPDPFRQGVPRFNGKNISRFIRDYEGMCRRYYVGDEREARVSP